MTDETLTKKVHDFLQKRWPEGTVHPVWRRQVIVWLWHFGNELLIESEDGVYRKQQESLVTQSDHPGAYTGDTALSTSLTPTDEDRKWNIRWRLYMEMKLNPGRLPE